MRGRHGLCPGEVLCNAFTQGVNKYKGDGQSLSQESDWKEQHIWIEEMLSDQCQVHSCDTAKWGKLGEDY